MTIKNKVYCNKGRLAGEAEPVQTQPPSRSVVVRRARAAQRRMVPRALSIQRSILKRKMIQMMKGLFLLKFNTFNIGVGTEIQPGLLGPFHLQSKM